MLFSRCGRGPQSRSGGMELAGAGDDIVSWGDRRRIVVVLDEWTSWLFTVTRYSVRVNEKVHGEKVFRWSGED